MQHQKLKVIAYCRVSTEMQEEKDSLKTQIKGVELFCEQNNYELLEIYSDVMSGGNRKRKGFLEAKKHIEKSDFDIFLAYDVSRIARDAFSFLELYNKLAEQDIKLKFINNPTLDSDSHLGRLILTVLAAIMEFFRFDNSKKVRDWMITRVIKDKRRMAGSAPFGYRFKNKTLEIVEEEAEEVRYIYTEYLKGRTAQSLAKELNRPITTIKARLDNGTYSGINIFGKYSRPKDGTTTIKNKEIIISEGDWQPIIPKNIFEEVKKIRDINRENRTRWTEKRTEFLLTGFTFHSCGGKFRGSNADGGKYKYYVCRDCGKSFKKDIFEKSVFDELLKEKFLENLNNDIIENNDSISKVNRINKKIEALKKENKKAKDMLLKEIFSEQEYIETKSENSDKINELEKTILNLEKDNIVQERLDINVIEIFKEVLSNLDINDYIETKAILKKIIKRIDFKNLNDFDIYLNI